MRTQYIVKESNKENRKEFYNYLKKTYKLKSKYPYFRKLFINNPFPFVIDFKDNSLWIGESITGCACAEIQNVMFTIEEFKNDMKGS